MKMNVPLLELTGRGSEGKPAFYRRQGTTGRRKGKHVDWNV